MNRKKNPLWSAIFRQGIHDGTQEMLDFLGTSPLFAGLSNKELRSLAAIVHQRSYQEGEYVFRKGQPGAAMFIIKSGLVSVIDHGRDNLETVISTLQSEDFFGELALLDDSPRSASALVTTSSEIYAFSRSDLDNLLTSSPQIGMQIYRTLAIIIGTRLKDANAQLSEQ